MADLRDLLYRTARGMGDVRAIRKGPQATGKRILRKAAGRATGRVLGRLFR